MALQNLDISNTLVALGEFIKNDSDIQSLIVAITLDLFYAHIGGMDTFARGLKIAAEIRKSGELENMVKERYSSWESGIGADIEAGKVCFNCLEKYMLEKGEVAPLSSGRQELYENVFNKYIK